MPNKIQMFNKEISNRSRIEEQQISSSNINITKNSIYSEYISLTRDS